ncbi:hypothetical protein [Nocardia terpenica]|uniref:Uncharacterized protein n=1 Tax=Nocardia terpenica TaxID=455432 RepID=A0A164LDL1_9NOCA|nr:hypothetical protein [Nocardia terpenica]KZM72293.1 hypothetical protein AWN90_37085 [Nocardia terpenica]NQE86561.1 hypothetical protein [Nocardia terpenica]
MTIIANVLHVTTAIVCLIVALIRLPRWRDVASRAMTIMLLALSALMQTTVSYNFEWEREAIGATAVDLLSYTCAVIISVAMIYLGARAWSFTNRLWLTHTAAVVAGGLIGAYISIAVHHQGESQAEFLLMTTAIIAAFAGLFLFMASLAAGVDKGIPKAARWSLLILATASLLWAIGAIRRVGDNVPADGALVDFASSLPWEAVTWSALLFAAAAALGMYLPWQDDAPLKPDREVRGSLKP